MISFPKDRVSPCLELFWTDRPFQTRIELAAKVGLHRFEFWTWWDKDIQTIADALDSTGSSVLGFCTKFVPLTEAGSRNLYVKGLQETIGVSEKLGSKLIISQVGNAVPGESRESQLETIAAGLKEAAIIVERAGMTLLIEPLNAMYDHPGYFLTNTEEAIRVLRMVSSPNVKLLFDVYHQQVTEGNILNNIESNIDWIGHFHIADVPGRHEPGTGELNYPVILDRILKSGYEGFVGLEFFPENHNHESLLKDLFV